MRLLVKELRVMSRDEILPTYRVPPVGRAPNGRGVLIARCANQIGPVVAGEGLTLG